MLYVEQKHQYRHRRTKPNESRPFESNKFMYLEKRLKKLCLANKSTNSVVVNFFFSVSP